MCQHNNSSSMEFQRQSDPNNGRTMLLKSNPMEDPAMFIALQPSIQDGGNSSECKVHSLSMIKERSSMFKEAKMERTRMS